MNVQNDSFKQMRTIVFLFMNIDVYVYMVTQRIGMKN